MVLDKEWLRKFAQDAARVRPPEASATAIAYMSAYNALNAARVRPPEASAASTSNTPNHLEREKRELALRKFSEEQSRLDRPRPQAQTSRPEQRARREQVVHQRAIGAMLASSLLWAIGFLYQFNEAAWLLESRSELAAPYRYAMHFYGWTILGTFDLASHLFSGIQHSLNAVFSNLDVAGVCAFFLTGFIALPWVTIFYYFCHRFPRVIVLVHYSPLLCAVIWFVSSRLFAVV